MTFKTQTPYAALKALVAEAIQDGPWATSDDGWYWCWFCGGGGSWEKEKIEHEADCVYLRLSAHIDGTGPISEEGRTDG